MASQSRTATRARAANAPLAALFGVLGSPLAASAALSGPLSVEHAWVAPSDAVGVDVGLFMTVKNDADEADALLRASCPVANFSEKRTVDVGEGGLADRAIPNIPIAAHSTLTMTSKTYHIGLLQTRDKLTAGDAFVCNLSFRRAGAMEVKVTVSPPAP
jgi:copper(I)-binding protein